ncbi:MAG: replication-associated recombination protein A [Candidatus Kerfeldbacteria bacterium]
MADLFDTKLEKDLRVNAPLADRMRPRTFDEFFGQQEAVGKGTILRRAVENDELFSILFWGPPGSGKTTIASIVAGLTKSEFIHLSAVDSGKEDLRRIVKAATERRKMHGSRTILFIDEIHRWNKAQQDALLPYVEQGIVTLIGATTENPSFEVISPLLSRTRVIVLKRLDPAHLQTIVEMAIKDTERGLGTMNVSVEPKAMRLLTTVANGDARTALNALEISAKATKPDAKKVRTLTLETVAEALQHRALLYDKSGEEHYNVISAFIKSMRGSNPDAALYYLGRMLEAGEDPLFIARRMIIFASEDIGVADPNALPLAVVCMQACDMIGMPECKINLSHVAVYLSCATKSNDTYVAYGKAVEDVKRTLNEPVPLNLRNASTDLMKELGYHKGYKYSHDYAPEDADQQYLPDALRNAKYYTPGPKGAGNVR